MKTTSNSSATNIFKFASIAFFAIALVSLGLFLAIIWGEEVRGPVDTTEFNWDEGWQTVLPYLELYRIPIVTLLVFAIAAELAIVLGIFSCIREKHFRAVVDFFVGIYREIKALVTTLYNDLKSVIKKSIGFMTSRMSTVQVVSLALAIFFAWWSSVDYDSKFYYLSYLAAGVFFGTLFTAGKSDEKAE